MGCLGDMIMPFKFDIWFTTNIFNFVEHDISCQPTRFQCSGLSMSNFAEGWKIHLPGTLRCNNIISSRGLKMVLVLFLGDCDMLGSVALSGWM